MLAVRLFWYKAGPYLPVLLPGWGVAAAASWVVFTRRKYGDADVQALTDRLCGAGGLLLTLSDRSDVVWEAKLESAVRASAFAVPRLRGRMLVGPLPYAAFLAIALVLPQRVPPPDKIVSPLQYGELKELAEGLELVSEEELLNEEESQEFREEIEKMIDSPGESLESRWEAIDSLKEKVAAEVQETYDALAGAERAASWGSKEQVERSLLSLSQKGLLGDAPRELAQALGQAGEAGLSKPPSLDDPKTLQAARAYMKQLAKAKCSRLARSGMVRSGKPGGKANLDDFKVTKRPGGGLPCGSGSCAGEGCQVCLGNGFDPTPKPDGDGKPGRGGINRGRGDAPMIWGDESDVQKVKFTARELPSVTIGPDEEMPVIGISIIQPEETEPGAPSASGRVTDFERASGGELWQRRISPRHRPLVRKYFTEEKEE